jgi:hypothetical protein
VEGGGEDRLHIGECVAGYLTLNVSTACLDSLQRKQGECLGA